MNVETRVYSTTQGCHDRDAALAVLRALAKEVLKVAARLPGLGWQVLALGKEEDLKQPVVPPEFKDSATSRRWPGVIIKLSFNLAVAPAGDPELEALLDAFGFVRVEGLLGVP